MGFVDTLNAAEVDTPEAFARYVQETTGTPYPRGKDIAILKRELKDFFKQYPHLNYMTLVRTVDWCRSKKRRFAHVYQVVGQYRYAWQAGAIPEFADRPNGDEILNGQIEKALEIERDPDWRFRLIGAEGDKARREVFLAWQIKVS